MGAGRAARHMIKSDVQAFLERLGDRCEKPATLYLLGGSALLLLGSPRPTIDIDYLGSDLPQSAVELQRTIQQVADEMEIDVEAIPFQSFIPLPAGAETRHVSVGKFGRLTAYVFDPYSIALSKIERGFESDLEDILFLIRQKLITFPILEREAQEMLDRSSEFDLNAQEIRAHLEALERMQ